MSSSSWSFASTPKLNCGYYTDSNEKGHFQIVLGGIGTSLLVMVIGFIFVVWIGGFFRGLGIATPKEDNLLVYALVFLM